MNDAHVLTVEDLLASHGEVTVGDVLAVLDLGDEALLRHAAHVLREGGERPELRRLVAWRLGQVAEGIENPKKAKKTKKTFDFKLAREFYWLREEEKLPYKQTVERLSKLPDDSDERRQDDRTPSRKAKQAKDEGERRMREFADRLAEAWAAMLPE